MATHGSPARVGDDHSPIAGDDGENPVLERLLDKAVALAISGKPAGPELRKDVQLLLEEAVAALAPGHAAAETKKPFYDSQKHELWWDGRLLKKWRAGTRQEELVRAFAEKDWATRIDNPFTNPKEDCHDLLLNTLKNLKKALPHGPIRFSRDGRCGVRWWIENA
jgi:hypothetical protein